MARELGPRNTIMVKGRRREKTCSARINPKMADNRNLICVTKTRDLFILETKKEVTLFAYETTVVVYSQDQVRED